MEANEGGAAAAEDAAHGAQDDGAHGSASSSASSAGSSASATDSDRVGERGDGSAAEGRLDWLSFLQKAKHDPALADAEPIEVWRKFISLGGKETRRDGGLQAQADDGEMGSARTEQSRRQTSEVDRGTETSECSILSDDGEAAARAAQGGGGKNNALHLLQSDGTLAGLGGKVLFSEDDLELFQRQYGLKKWHVKQFARLFLRLDKDASLTIDRWELFAWLDEIRLGETIFCGALLDLVQVRTPGMLSFAEFVAALSTMALFGGDDMLRYCFFALDVDKNGYIDRRELRTLVDMLHGGTETDLYDVERVLELFDANRDGVINFAEFRDINRAHAFLLFPAFRLQQRIEDKVMGRRFWRRKRAKLVKMRRKAKELASVEEAAGDVEHETSPFERAATEEGAGDRRKVHFLSDKDKGGAGGSFSSFRSSARALQGSASNLLAKTALYYRAWLAGFEALQKETARRRNQVHPN